MLPGKVLLKKKCYITTNGLDRHEYTAIIIQPDECPTRVHIYNEGTGELVGDYDFNEFFASLILANDKRTGMKIIPTVNPYTPED